jgi:hypothetical protein
MKRWDVFISHASEDKDIVAFPLAETLTRAGLRVWLDKQELRLGDSLREKIDEGLAESRFGVVILSPNFLAKSWPRKELNGLMAIEEDGRKVILPIWHNITKAILTQYSPILADRLAANTEDGIDSVASEIIKVVFAPDSESPSALSPTVGRRFIELVDSTNDILKIKAFLAAHPRILLKALGVSSAEESGVQWSIRLDDFVFDMCVSKTQSTTGRLDWYILVFETLSDQLFVAESQPVPSLARSVAQLESLRKYIQQNLKKARNILPGINPSFQATVVAGRRKQLTQETINYLREYNDYLFGIQVRTYDWLISAAMAIPGEM